MDNYESRNRENRSNLNEAIRKWRSELHAREDTSTQYEEWKQSVADEKEDFVRVKKEVEEWKKVKDKTMERNEEVKNLEIEAAHWKRKCEDERTKWANEKKNMNGKISTLEANKEWKKDWEKEKKEKETKITGLGIIRISQDGL